MRGGADACWRRLTPANYRLIKHGATHRMTHRQKPGDLKDRRVGVDFSLFSKNLKN